MQFPSLQKSMVRAGVVGVLLATCAGCAGIGDSVYDARLDTVGQNAPAFSLPTASGGQVTLGETLKDKKAVLVNFWLYT